MQRDEEARPNTLALSGTTRLLARIAHDTRDRSDRALAEWESHLACNEKPVVWNLRNPTKAAIASALHVLAGILPIHVGCPAPAPRAALLRST